MLALIAVLIGAIKYVIRSETADLRFDISKIKDNIADVQKRNDDTNHRIDALLSDAMNKLVAAAKGTSGKKTKAALESGQQILELAKNANAKLRPEALQAFGAQAANLASDPALAPVAWRSFTEAVGYRTLLNVDYVPIPADLVSLPPEYHYRISINIRPDPTALPGALSLNVFHPGGFVTEEDSARLETLSMHQSPSKVRLFVINGGVDSIVLDGMYMKNVIIRNARVIYEGGPVQLENVSFVNCTFLLAQKQPVKQLGDAILQTASVDFTQNKG